MYRQVPRIETKLEALDELEDVRMTLAGLAAFALALSKSGVTEPEAAQLTSCLLDCCAATVREAVGRFEADNAA